jgi:hypothetical protein
MEIHMNAHIHSWTDGFLALREHAFATRGAIELDTGAKWPRTTGDDVVIIAALFDPSVRDSATPGLLRRWHGALDEIKHEALTAPIDTYGDNRSFWSTLEVAAIVLDEHAYPMPGETSWRRLLREVGGHGARNAGGDIPPFGPFADAHSLDEIYLAEYKLLRDQRGADTLKPPTGFAGMEKPIPRTTNADVLQLAAYWSAQLGAAKRIMGTDAVTTLWQTAMHDVNAITKTGKPTDVYSKNNEFWRSLGELAVHVAAAAEAPTSWDIAKDTAAHLPSTLVQAAGKAAGAVADAGHAVGEGILAALKKPLYIAGGLVGLYFLTRNRGEH